MKKMILLLIIAASFASCQNKQMELCSGSWILTNKSDIGSEEKYKPSTQKIKMTFNNDGSLDYYEDGKKVGLNCAYSLKGDNLNLSLDNSDGIEMYMSYKISRLDSIFLSLTEMNNTAVPTYLTFVKAGSQMAKVTETFTDYK